MKTEHTPTKIKETNEIGGDLVLPKDFVEISIKSGERSFSARGERVAVRDSAMQFLEKVLIPDLDTIEKYMKALGEFALKTKKSHEEVLILIKKMEDIVKNSEQKANVKAIFRAEGR